MNKLKIRTAMPPTTNHAYINLPLQGNRRCRMLTDEARIFKTETEWLAKIAAQKQGWKYEHGQRLSLSVVFHFNRSGKRDLSNRIKLLEDSLAAGTGFDDSMIDRIELVRGNKTPMEFCEVELGPFGEPLPATKTLNGRKHANKMQQMRRSNQMAEKCVRLLQHSDFKGSKRENDIENSVERGNRNSGKRRTQTGLRK